MLYTVHPNLTAKSMRLAPPKRSLLISLTSSLVNAAAPCVSPFGFLPFKTQSLWLSLVVPWKRWFGFTHEGTSHLWQIEHPFGTEPCSRIHERRWALLARLETWNIPYPSLSLHPDQIQHSFADRLSTNDQKRSTSFGSRLTKCFGSFIEITALFISHFVNCVKAISVRQKPRWLAYCGASILAVNASADWKSSQVIYFYSATHPAVMLTTNTVSGIQHASGSVSAIQIGDQNGINTNLCTAFISDGVCGGSIPNCEWGHITNNLVVDVYLFSTCRPLTNGLTQVVTNLAVGSPVVIYALLSKTWHNATLTSNNEAIGFVTTFDDGSTGFFYTSTVTNPGLPTSGQSGSLVFTQNGVFIGHLSGLDGGDFALMSLYPNGVTYGSTSSSSGAAGLSALFNSDPDR